MITLDPELMEILACPACKSPLRIDDTADELVCTNAACALAYPVRDDIPVLLVDEARGPDKDDDHGDADDPEESADGDGDGKEDGDKK